MNDFTTRPSSLRTQLEIAVLDRLTTSASTRPAGKATIERTFITVRKYLSRIPDNSPIDDASFALLIDAAIAEYHAAPHPTVVGPSHAPDNTRGTADDS